MPDGYGVYTYRNRPDVVSGYVCDPDGNIIGSILWVSKRAYDNYATLTAHDPPTERLDMTNAVLVNGRIRIIEDPLREYNTLIAIFNSQLAYHKGTGEKSKRNETKSKPNTTAAGIFPTTPVKTISGTRTHSGGPWKR